MFLIGRSICFGLGHQIWQDHGHYHYWRVPCKLACCNTFKTWKWVACSPGVQHMGIHVALTNLGTILFCIYLWGIIENTCKCTCTYTYSYTWPFLYMCAYTSTCTHTHISYAHIPICSGMYGCMYVCMYVCMHACTFMYSVFLCFHNFPPRNGHLGFQWVYQVATIKRFISSMRSTGNWYCYVLPL